MIQLSFTNVDVFQTANAWKIFKENIGKLTLLSVLEITDCGLKEFPDDVMKQLPKSVTCLSLENNKLSKISANISELENLTYFNLNNNPELDDKGFPWDKLPENLEIIKLNGTKIKQMPKDMNRFKNLATVIIEIDKLEVIFYHCLNENLFYANFRQLHYQIIGIH